MRFHRSSLPYYVYHTLSHRSQNSKCPLSSDLYTALVMGSDTKLGSDTKPQKAVMNHNSQSRGCSLHCVCRFARVHPLEMWISWCRMSLNPGVWRNFLKYKWIDIELWIKIWVYCQQQKESHDSNGFTLLGLLHQA